MTARHGNAKYGVTILSTQNETKAQSKAPVSSHPLFPAIVALWFGALFGLGSLAVRASLIESLVISSHIDVLVPMAAPPLGMTARILLALFMAMIGIAAGAAIARRIARPKPVARNRRRTAGSVSDSEARKADFAREARAQQVERQMASDKVDAVRRRALANDEAHNASSHHDGAPLPGSAPQILDVTQFDLAAPGSFEADLAKEVVAEVPLDLTGFAAPHAEFQEAELAEQPAIEQPTIDLANIDPPVPVLESYGDDTDSFRAKFANEKKPVEWTPEPPPSCAESFEATNLVDDAAEFVFEPADSAGLRSFDPLPLTAADQPQGHADFALLGSDLAAPSPGADMVAASPEGSAGPDVAAAVPVPELRRFDGPAGTPMATPISSLADLAVTFADDLSRASEASEASEATGPAATREAESARVLPQSSAAQRIASAELAELSPVELVERFALALKQRRHTGAFPAGLLETAAAFDLPVGPQPSQVPEVLAAMAPLAEPVVASEPEAPEAPQAIVAARPLFAATASCSSEIDDALVTAVRMPLALPEAMRPIEFGQHEEHDDLPDYAPPRSFAMPRPAEVPAEPEAEADVNEEGYSSLLALTRTAPLRQTFVRIEEPASEFAQVEPVVIFPGQATRPGTRFARPSEDANPAEPLAAAPQSPVELPHAAAPGLRRFDAPTAGEPAAAAGTSGVQDPAEAERALRSALATLQRMSGAA